MNVNGMKSMAYDAVELLLKPSIETLLMRAKRQHLHIVVMNPQIKPWDGVPFEEAILYEKSIGDKKEWEHPYDEIARSKAKQAWRNQQANLATHMFAPATLLPGDTVYWGSFEYHGVITAASGVEPWYDMLVSGWVALAFQQLAQSAFQRFKTDHPDANFLE